MSEWKEVKLGDFFKVKYGFAFKGKNITVWDLRNDIGTTSHGKTLEEIKERNSKVDYSYPASELLFNVDKQAYVNEYKAFIEREE